MLYVQMGTVLTGQNFKYDNKMYVRIPEMILRIGAEGFVVNCAKSVSNEDDHEPSTVIMEYISDRTLVNAFETVLR